MGGESDMSTAEKATLNIRCTNGTRFSVDAVLTSSVGAFKAIVAQSCDIPADQQKLIYKGRILKDSDSLESYGVQNDHTVHLVRGASSSATANLPAPGNPVASTNAPQPVGGVSTNYNGGFGVGSHIGSTTFPASGGNAPGQNGLAGIFGLGSPELQPDQEQLTQNRGTTRDMMSNIPAIQSLMNNPDLMRNLIMSNPQMREIIDRNPDLAHILNDPGTLRQTLDAARNPELMREMMRNTDRAMSNIESSPEGFNMLRRMYETVQEPFLNATTMGGPGVNELGPNPFAALGLGQNRGQAQNPSSDNSDTTTDSAAPNTNPLPNPWNLSSNTAGAGAAGGQRTPGIRAASGIGAQLPGFGLLDIGGPGGGSGLSDPAMLQQMLQNPAIMQMMQGLLSNPQYMNQIFSSYPQFRSLLNSNSQLREIMQNPEFLQQLTSPESMQQMLSLHQSLLSQINRTQSGQTQDRTAAGANNLGLESLLSMFGGLGTINTPNAGNALPPEQLYAIQLSQLQDMGFVDTQENIRALNATGGNVHAAVERLLGNIG